MRRFVLLSSLLCLSLLAGCANATLPIPWPAMPTSVLMTPTPRVWPTPLPNEPTATPLPTPIPELTGAATYTAALRPEAGPAPAEGLTEYRLTVDLADDLRRVAGQADIRYTNREQAPLDAIYLHLYPNLWDGGMVATDVRVAGQPITPTYPSGDDILGLPLAAALRPGESITLSLRFAEPIPTGAGVGNYGELGLGDGVLALAHFYPTVAVYDTGWRLETPALQGDVIFHDASLYDVTLTAPADLMVVATGATLGRTIQGKQAVWRLGGGPMRDFNIIASRDYRSASTQAGDITVNSYFLPGDAESGEEALRWTARALTFYQQTFGTYPYRELDVVATATTAGGIEYPGLVVVADRLYRDPSRHTFFESATVHEVAHQWWYNVVGNDQVNAPWLDESLAQYSTYLYFRDAYGEAGAQGFIESLNARWARVGNARKPIGLPVANYTDAEYGAIVYGRGALFFLALRDRLGEAKMAELLRRYYTEETWRVATPEAFRSLAEQVAGSSLADLWQEWVEP